MSVKRTKRERVYCHACFGHGKTWYTDVADVCVEQTCGVCKGRGWYWMEVCGECGHLWIGKKKQAQLDTMLKRLKRR